MKISVGNLRNYIEKHRILLYVVLSMIAMAALLLAIFSIQLQNFLLRVFCMFVAFAALFVVSLWLWKLPSRNSETALDEKFERRAVKGDAIILSFQQYMALHYTAPERYPLQRDEVSELLRSEESNLHMNVQDYNQLLEVIKALEQDQNTPLAKFLERSIALLEQIDRSLEKKAWCHRYSVYTVQNDNHRDFFTSLDEFMAGAYENGLVINDYKNIIKTYELDTQDIKNANYSWLEKQPKQCVLACIAWHFRNDHFCEGVLIRESIPSGAMLRLLRRLQSLCPDGDLSCM